MNIILLTTELIDQVGEYLGSDWYRLLCYIKKGNEDIDFLRHEVERSVYVAPHILLTGWYSSKTEINKFDKLTYALLKCQRVDIVEFIHPKKDIELSADDLLGIVERLGDKWKDFLIYLGLEFHYIESVRRSITLSTTSPNILLMRKWYRVFQAGDKSSLFKELIEGLSKIGRLDLINMLSRE